MRFVQLLLRSLGVVTALLALVAFRLPAQGTISGLVVDAGNGLTITGATVQLRELQRTVISDRAGRFVIANVPAGSYQLEVRYLGYAPRSERVTVTNGATATITLRLEVARTELGAVVVTATRTGQAAALSQQRAAPNVTNVIAADQIGRFPDANIGDALKRVPGVSIELDQGEARFGGIRGTEPRFNSYMVNGERIPSAEAEVRDVQLDLIPSDMVQAVEVNKTLTPEMDADAIGGSVNIVTRAAPAGFRLSTTVGGGYNAIREGSGFIGGLVAGNRFFDDRLGALVSASFYDQRFGSDNKEGTWSRTDDGRIFMDEFDLRRYDVDRTRRSISGSFDWRFNATNSVIYRGVYNSRDDWENRYRQRFVFEEPDASGQQEAEIRRQTKGGGPDPRNRNARLEDQRTQSHQLSGEHFLGDRGIELTWSASVSRASETRPDERYIEWRARDVMIDPNYTDEQNPTFSPTSALTGSNFTFRRIEQQESFTRDLDRNGRVDLLIPLRDGDNGMRLKLGARYRGKEKNRDNSFNRASPENGSAFANLTAQGFKDFSVSDNLAGPYQYGVFTTPATLAGLDLFNPSAFELEDRPDEYAAGNFTATEAITAGYAQIERSFGPALSTIVGVRVENTSVDYDGFEFNIDDETISPTSGTSSYTDILPSINVRWARTPNLIVRAAVTRSLARPNYFDLVPYREVSIEDDELALGNPNLEPTRSTNFDLMVERYFESVGLVQAGVFHKAITDFIFPLQRDDAVDPVTGRTFNAITQPQNGDKARITGVELAFQRQLDFLPGALRYLGLYANYTYNNSSAEGTGLAGRENDDLPLLGTPEHLGNLSISFDTPRFNVRVAVNHQSASLDAREGSYSDDPFFDRWLDRRTDVDMNGSVQITPSMRFFLEANNLTDRPLRYYQGVRGRLMQDEFYGRRLQTGFKFDF